MKTKKHAKAKATPRKQREPYKRKDPKELKAELVVLDPTAGHRSRRWFGSYHESMIEDLPLFRLRHAEMMMFDPVVRFGMNVRDAALTAGKVEIAAADEGVKTFLQTQWDTLWGKFASKILKTKRWGYAGHQIVYSIDNKTGHLIIDDVKDFSPYDVRALTQAGRVVGFRLRNRSNALRGSVTDVNLLAPRGLWTTFDAEHGRNYGTPILRRSFGPWWEKWMDHGFKKTSQLRMMKDACRGDQFKYPPDRFLTDPAGNQTPWRDIMRDMGESMMNGSMLTFPAMYDDDGHALTEYKEPKDTGNPSGIWEWGDRLDKDIWRGCDVFSEVIEAAASGSGYSGRSVPLMMFLQACMMEFLELVQAIDRDVLRPLAWLNFGKDPEYRITPTPLIETFTEATQGSAMGGGAMGGQQSEGGGPRGPGRQKAGPFVDFTKQDGSIGKRRNPFFQGSEGGNGSPFQMAEWSQVTGPRGGQGWRNQQTGEIRYQQEMPSENGDGLEEEPDIQQATPEEAAGIKSEAATQAKEELKGKRSRGKKAGTLRKAEKQTLAPDATTAAVAELIPEGAEEAYAQVLEDARRLGFSPENGGQAAALMQTTATTMGFEPTATDGIGRIGETAAFLREQTPHIELQQALDGVSAAANKGGDRIRKYVEAFGSGNTKLAKRLEPAYQQAARGLAAALRGYDKLFQELSGQEAPAQMAEFREEQHPRTKGGEFASKGQGDSGKIDAHVEHALGTLAAKSLGGPVPQKSITAAMKVLHKQGLIPRIDMDADTAFKAAKAKLPKTQKPEVKRKSQDEPVLKSARQLRIEADELEKGQTSVTDPKPDETASEFMDRILGKPGSKQRKLGDPAAFQHWLMVWDAFQANKRKANPQEEDTSLASRFED